MNIGDQIAERVYFNELKKQNKLLEETIDVYKQYVDMQKEEIAYLTEKVNQLLKLSNELAVTAKKAIREAESSWVNS